MDQGLAVLTAFFGLAAVGALIMVQRSLLPFRQDVDAVSTGTEEARAALRASALKSLFALAVSATVAVGLIFLAVAVGWDFSTGLFLVPLAAVAAGLAAYALVPSRPAPPRSVATAALSRRRATDHLPRRWLTVCGGTGLLLLLCAITASAQPDLFLTPQRWSLPLTALGDAALLTASWCALHRVTSQPALPQEMASVDAIIRGSTGRLIALLTSAALLTSTAALLLSLGYQATSLSDLHATDGAPDPVLHAAGIALTVLGAIAATASLAAVLTALTVTISLTRASRNARRDPAPTQVTA